MSRRHHGGRPHRANGPGRPLDSSRPLGPAPHPDHQPAGNPAAVDSAPDARGISALSAQPEERLRPAAAAPLERTPSVPTERPLAATNPETSPDRQGGEPLSRIEVAQDPSAPDDKVAAAGVLLGAPVEALGRGPGFNPSRLPSGPPLGIGGACTAPQLRRFIKSRPYVPMHELRRRFGIDGGEDDVTSVDLASGRIYVGLPSREGSLLGELLRGGEVGFELSLDPRSPVVVGLYPMRPVART
jgi:hypothetical protein